MPEPLNRQKDIFLNALELSSPEDRAAYLSRECGSDVALRAQIEAMLSAHGVQDSFLEKPAAAMGITVDLPHGVAPAEPLSTVSPGMRIGNYKLLEQIGDGGMGVVYVAEQQEPVRRVVALKIIKPGMDNAQVLARFEAERQALALMDHPNIARVLDAGTTADGRPFFVMELVKGTPITTFCDANKLSPRQRLELFVPVCQAIQHAHQKGVIHRDIKPSNVLIALYDDRPVPKVIDFGVAKATGNPLTERTLHTCFGAIVGTPEYMSPEQATFNQLDIDTRSDVYSLGVLLYELLTGSTPVDKTHFKAAAILEILRVVREEEPARPSVKLSTTAARASIAATRGTDSDKLAQLLRGELDWIVMKSLEKDRNRRYDTAASMARDVDRYLKDELVEARPPSAAYRLGKFVKRNRGTVVAASLLTVLLLGGVIGTTLGMLQARDAERRATDARMAADENKMIADLHRDDAIMALADVKASERKAKAQTIAADTARHAFLIEQAMSAWESRDVGEATRFLDRVAPEFQQTWETRFLRDLCQRKFRPFPMPADEAFGPLMPSRDGKWLIGSNYLDDPDLSHVLDANTGKTRFKFKAPPRGSYFSHNGKWLLATGNVEDKDSPFGIGKAKVFDLQTGRERFALADVPGGILRATVSPNDTRIALGCRGKVLVCDSSNGKVMQTVVQSGLVGSVEFSPDGKSLAVSSYGIDQSDGAFLIIWDLESGKEKFLGKRMETDALAWSMAFSPDGKNLALSWNVRFVELMDAQTGATRWTRKSEDFYHGIDFSPDGKHIACVNENQVMVLDASTGQIEQSFKANGPHGFGRGTPLTASGLTYLPDGSHVLVSSGVWNLNTVRPEKFKGLLPENYDSDSRSSAGFGAGGKSILACWVTFRGLNAVLSSWNAQTEENTPAVAGPDNPIFAHAISQNGQRIVFGCWAIKRDEAMRAGMDGLLRVWDANTLKELVALEVPATTGLNNMAINADGTVIALTDGKRITIWDGVKGTKKQTCEGTPRGIGCLAVSADGQRLASADNEAVFIWDVATGKPLYSCSIPSSEAGKQVFCLAFRPDGRHLVAGLGGLGKTGSLILWDADTGQVVHTMKGHTASATSVAFSPDCKRLATASLDQTIRLWDVATGQEVLTIRLSGVATNVVFSPDGKCLAAFIDSRGVTVWEAP